MKHIHRFYDYILEFKETDKNTPLLYKDDKLEVKVVKTFQSAKEQGKNTHWCSNSEMGFLTHNMTANMYRFNFSDGYKLRLTWDYITQKESHIGSFSGGTHWGQGGTVNGESLWYDVLRPEDDRDPFIIMWDKPEKREIVERILSIPEEAQKKCHEYQNKMSREKSSILNNLYHEIEKVKIVGVSEFSDDVHSTDLKVDLEYLNKKYTVKLTYCSRNDYWFSLGDFNDVFKNKYHKTGAGVMKNYIFDKAMSWLKSNQKFEIIDLLKTRQERYKDKES